MISWTRTAGDILRLLVLVVLVVLLHLTVIPHIRVFGIAPDLTIVLLVYIGLWQGAVGGTSWGFAIGLIQGLSTPVHFGVHSLAKTIVGFGVGKLKPHIVREALATQVAVIVGSHLVHDLILAPLTLAGAGSTFQYLLTRTLPGAVYSALFGCLIYRFVLRPIGLDLRSHGASIL
jgi:rod shape-determining protein MreD